jgi:hypothetical protein
VEKTIGLTEGYDAATDKMIHQTYPGQASWAGGGPPGKICNDCKHYGGYMPTGGRSRSGPQRGQLRYGNCRTRCMKFYQLMGKISTKTVPPSALACHYFEPHNDIKW